MTEERFLGRKDITSDVRRIQAMFGTLYAGGGVVVLDASGIRVVLSDAVEDWSAYRFVDADGVVISRLTGYMGLLANTVMLEVLPQVGRQSLVDIRATSPVGDVAQAEIVAYQAAGSYAGVYSFVDAVSYEYISNVINGAPILLIDADGIEVTGKIITSTAIGARVERTSDLAIANATWTAVTWNTERVDTDGIWAAGTPTRFTPQHAGYYTVEGCINFLSNATGLRGIGVRLNGTTMVRMQQLAAINGADTALAVTAGMHLFNGTTDYAEIMAYQNSGGALNLNYIAANWEFIQASITRQA